MPAPSPATRIPAALVPPLRSTTGDQHSWRVGSPVGHALDALGAVGAQLGDAGNDGNATANGGEDAHRAAQVGGDDEAGQVAQRPRSVLVRRGVEDGVDPHARVEVLPCDQPHQRPRAREDDAPLGNESGRLEQGLRRARRHDAGQRPSGDREGTLDRSGGEDHARRLGERRDARDRYAELEPGRDAPHAGARNVLRAAREELLDQLHPAPIVRTEDRGILQRRGGDTAIDLAAGRGLVVEEHGREAGARAKARRGEPRRAGADHRHFVLGGDGAHRGSSRGPRCVAICMPSRTLTRQPCTLPTPSMVTRHSKHAPAMQ